MEANDPSLYTGFVNGIIAVTEELWDLACDASISVDRRLAYGAAVGALAHLDEMLKTADEVKKVNIAAHSMEFLMEIEKLNEKRNG